MFYRNAGWYNDYVTPTLKGLLVYPEHRYCFKYVDISEKVGLLEIKKVQPVLKTLLIWPQKKRWWTMLSSLNLSKAVTVQIVLWLCLEEVTPECWHLGCVLNTLTWWTWLMQLLLLFITIVIVKTSIWEVFIKSWLKITECTIKTVLMWLEKLLKDCWNIQRVQRPQLQPWADGSTPVSR